MVRLLCSTHLQVGLPGRERDRRSALGCLCAAAADYLCMRDEMAPPAWVAIPAIR